MSAISDVRAESAIKGCRWKEKGDFEELPQKKKERKINRKNVRKGTSFYLRELSDNSVFSEKYVALDH